MTDALLTPIEIGLTAAIVTVEDEEPAILVAGDGATGEPRAGLPFGAFDPLTHRTFEIGLRAWVEAQTGLAVGYVEQLYTFRDRGRDAGEAPLARQTVPRLGERMRFDHRRILATAIARLRAKLKYRPVIFELMAREFTLTELQRTVEAISGRHLHKQNFRRLVEAAALGEPTGETSTATGGAPAAPVRFRREVVQERPAPGLRFGARPS